MSQRAKAGEVVDSPAPATMNNTDRAIAAITGAVATSVLMTPLDVVKTRLQVQHSSESGSAGLSSRPVSVLPASPKRAQPCTAQNLPNSAVSATAQRTASTSYPTSSTSWAFASHRTGECAFPNKCTPYACEAETILQEQRMNGILDGIFKVVRSEGWRGLWRGLGPTVAMTVPSQVTYMTCYDMIRRVLLPNKASASRVDLERFEENEVCVSDLPSAAPIEIDRITTPQLIQLPILAVSLVSGALSRSVSATLVTPLELLRTRLQASQDRSSMLSVVRSLCNEMSKDGPGVMWRGLSATLWRDVPFSAIYFSGYEAGKLLFTGAGFGESHTSTSWNEFSISFGVGATSGTLAAFLTQPFDLVKTRQQAETRYTTKRYPSSGEPSHPSSMFHILKRIVANEGTPGLFRGLTPRLAKVAPSCGIMIASFEVVGRWLAQRHSINRTTVE
ncbi:Carrier protein, mitochondrial [Malassezia yamatoensis]|uniref:Carrier protein, mitochondrial n=1 Tax=Malassezia yamatoensis TaxID=253288 RepID=A0AAJ6CHD1_9BASI|nr:Carrier protein, mitochondrial [Malassezia yamatoensis]